MALGDAYMFPGFLTPVLIQPFFPKPPTTFLTCFCRGERRKYAGKKSRLNRGSNSQPPGHEFDTLTTEPPGRGLRACIDNSINVAQEIICLYRAENMRKGDNTSHQHFLLSHIFFKALVLKSVKTRDFGVKVFNLLIYVNKYRISGVKNFILDTCMCAMATTLFAGIRFFKKNLKRTMPVYFLYNRLFPHIPHTDPHPSSGLPPPPPRKII